MKKSSIECGMLIRVLASIALAAGISGCANLQTVWRNEEAAGKTVSVDATQRVVVSTRGIEDGREVTRYCPEPSPDAIVAFASSLGLAGSGPAKGATVSVDAQTALASQVASVGLRTPTTQIIRDLITAACIAHMNGAFKDKHFTEAFERNQGFVLAAHAISVIGGEPAARQFQLNGSAGTGALADARNSYLDFQKAQTARIDAETDLAGKTQASGKAADAAAEAKAKHDEAVKAKKDAKTIQDLDAALKDAAGAAKTAAEDEVAAKKVRDDSVALEKQARAMSTAAAAGQSAATGSGSSAAPTSLAPASGSLSDASVNAISKIFDSTLLSGFSLERCLSQLTTLARLPDGEDKRTLVRNVMDLCTDTTQTALEQAKTRRTQAQEVIEKMRKTAPAK